MHASPTRDRPVRVHAAVTAARGLGVAAFGTGLALLAVSLGARLTLYAGIGLPGGLEEARARLLRGHVVAFKHLMPTVPLQVLGGLALLALFVAWRRFFLASRGDRRTFRAWVLAVAGLACVVHAPLFDADPFAAAWCWALAVVGLVGSLRLRGEAPSSVRARVAFALVAVAAVAAAFTAPSRVTAVAVLAWAAWVALASRLLRRLDSACDALLLHVLPLPLVTFAVPTLLAYAVPGLRAVPGVALQERGYAYSCCEVPETNTLFMAVPVGQTGDLDRLREGYVAEYDSRDFTRRAEHRFFDESFDGGLRQLVCLGDAVQVTMHFAHLGGVTRASNVFEFDASDPSRFRETIWPDRARGQRGWDLLGHVAVHDAPGRGVYYTSEWTRTVHRLDLDDGTLDTEVARGIPWKDFAPMETFGLFVRAGGIHQGRRTFYASEWVDGSAIHEVDLDGAGVLRSLDTGDTGAFGLTVDEELDRLLAVGLWGLSVIDLESGAIAHRRRLGPGGRSPTIDRRHGLVYVATTFGGHVWVLDRETYRTLGRLTTGLGGRASYLTLDGRFLLASDQARTYRWDAEELAERFGRR